ncbi:hypothetical protein CF328_g641 [Tilletia controversa]|nr:hypothetical protein CF328_g641 [Tilletia controversa]
MKPRLNTLMGQTQQELAALGDTTFLGDAYRGSLVLKRMTQFARDFVPPSTAPPSTSRPRNSDIRTAIRNSTGPRPSLFVL